MILLGIIWNPVYYECEKIIKDIEITNCVLETKTLNLESNLAHFIREIYNYPKDQKWRSELKTKDLVAISNKKVCVLKILFKSQKKVYYAEKDKIMYEEVLALKNRIRNKYKKCFINGKKRLIYPENVFHLADNPEESILQSNVIEKYYQMNRGN